MAELIFIMVAGLIEAGKDQRDIYYFVSLGHYKLEVGMQGGGGGGGLGTLREFCATSAF